VNLSLLHRLLRAPSEVAADCREDRELPRVAASSLVVIVVGAVLFGAAVGSWRGGAQIALSAFKLPLVTVGTLAVCVPAFHAIAAVFGRPWSLRSAVSILLVAGARFSLVLVAATPVLWLAIDLGASYDAVKLLASLAYGLAGLAALTLVLHGLGPGTGRVSAVLTFVAVFLVVGGQSAWILRPYIGRPGRDSVPVFTREREGGLAYQLWLSVEQVVTPTRPDRRELTEPPP
jgi:hypothetical protein